MREDRNLVLSKKLRIVIYNRVSTNAQEDEGSSLETQREDNTAYCLEHGYEIIDVVDETHTGYELEQRKKLKDILRRCMSKEVDGIVFRTYDRLSRNSVHRTVLEYDAERYGYVLLCSKEQYDGDSFEHKLMRQLMSAFAELERMKIKERTMAGKLKRAEEGKLINGQSARYGYAYADEKHTCYKVVDAEANIINKIDALYLAGNGMQVIADILTREGIASPTGKRVWNQHTIQRILNCEEYHGIGYAFYTRTLKEKGKRYVALRPVEERVRMPENTFPVIRTKETYDAIQERRKNAHNTSFTSSLPGEVLLRGFIKCPICNGTMSPALRRGKTPVYRCGKNQTEKGTFDRHNVQMVARHIENDVSNFVVATLAKINDVEAALQKYIDEHNSQKSANSYDNAIKRCKAQQVEISEELKGLRGNARALLLNQLNQLEDDIERMGQQKFNIVGDGERWEVMKRDVQEVIDRIHTGELDFEKADIQEKRRILRVLGISIKTILEDDVSHITKRRCSYEIYARMGISTLAHTS